MHDAAKQRCRPRRLPAQAQLDVARRGGSLAPPQQPAAPHLADLLAPAGRPATLPDLWEMMEAEHGDRVAVSDPHQQPAAEYTYRQLRATIRCFATGLQSLGVREGDRVSLFSENSSRWLVADQAILACGAADAVRGVSSSVEELQYIMEHSESSGLVVQDAATLDKLLPALAPANGSALPGHSPLRGAIRFVVVLWGEPSPAAAQALACPVLSFDGVLEAGAAADAGFQPPAGLSSDSLATLIYTSGTTGHPKGVMLSHGNLLYQTLNMQYFLSVAPGERTLSLLPPWHVYERATGYFLLRCGATQTYTNTRRFRDDLAAYAPDYLVCVPLVLETLHSRVMSTLRKASAVRRVLALNLLAASIAHVRAKRVVEGVALQYAIEPRLLQALVAAWLQMQLLGPLNCVQ